MILSPDLVKDVAPGPERGGGPGVQVGALLGPLQGLVLLLETLDDLQVGQPGGDLSFDVPGRGRKLLHLLGWGGIR